MKKGIRTKDETSGRFKSATPVSQKLETSNIPGKFVDFARKIEESDVEMKDYLRTPALRGMIRFFEITLEQSLPAEFVEETIVTYLDDLQKRASSPAYWQRYTAAMQEVAREMGHTFEVVDGFEARLPPPF